jgi:hypothetical protein
VRRGPPGPGTPRSVTKVAGAFPAAMDLAPRKTPAVRESGSEVTYNSLRCAGRSTMRTVQGAQRSPTQGRSVDISVVAGVVGISCGFAGFAGFAPRPFARAPRPPAPGGAPRRKRPEKTPSNPQTPQTRYRSRPHIGHGHCVHASFPWSSNLCPCGGSLVRSGYARPAIDHHRTWCIANL